MSNPTGKESACNAGDQGSILEEAMATHSSILALSIQQPGDHVKIMRGNDLDLTRVEESQV